MVFNVTKRIMVVITLLILNIILMSCGNEKLSNDSKSATEPLIVSKPTALNQSSIKSNDDSYLPKSIIENKDEPSVNSKTSSDEVQLHNLFEKGYYDYLGEINQNLKIRMSLYPVGNTLIGTYFYENIQNEIKLQGNVEANQIILNEFDENGNITGIFKGDIKSVDEFNGTWSSQDGKKKYDFKVSLCAILTGAEYGHRYSVAEFDNDVEIEKFVGNLQLHIKNEDKEEVASLVAYPISVKINGKHAEIKNKDEFISNYNNIFYPHFKKTMLNTFTKYMFANWQGVMFGENMYNMWINVIIKPHKLETLITSINN